jgi:drug/metabolite transporter (DMT)-like permease
MLWNTSPVFIPIIARVLFKERVGKVAWMSIFLGLIGIVCILQPESKIFDPFSFWGLFAGFTMALSQVLYGHNRESSRTDVNVFYLFAFTSLISLTILFVFNGILENNLANVIEPIFMGGYRPYLYAAVISIGSIGNQFLRGSAYSFATPSFLSPFIYLAVLFSGFLDWIIFNQVPNFLFVIGSILVVFSVFIRIAFSHKH